MSKNGKAIACAPDDSAIERLRQAATKPAPLIARIKEINITLKARTKRAEALRNWEIPGALADVELGKSQSEAKVDAFRAELREIEEKSGGELEATRRLRRDVEKLDTEIEAGANAFGASVQTATQARLEAMRADFEQFIADTFAPIAELREIRTSVGQRVEDIVLRAAPLISSIRSALALAPHLGRGAERPTTMVRLEDGTLVPAGTGAAEQAARAAHAQAVASMNAGRARG